MNKLFVSAGLIAVGAAGVQSVHAQGSEGIAPKAWSVGASLRGFYDDNYDVGQSKRGSFGTELSPTLSYNMPLRQTDMGIRYNYTLYYYQNRQDRGQDPFDQSHQLDFWWDHAINENWHLNFTDTFGYGQEPELLQPNPLVNNATPFRVNGDNIGNHANISLTTQWTRELGTTLHYGNDFYQYSQHGATAGASGAPPDLTLKFLPDSTPFTTAGAYSTFTSPGGAASLAGLLNRVEQNVSANVNWTFSPELTVYAGYTFTIANYLGNEPIAVYNYNTFAPQQRGLVYNSSSRDSLSHEVHVGGNWVINPNLSLAAQIGAQYTDSYNDPLQHNTTVSPTANISLTYTYLTGSYAQLGISQSQNATDIVAPDTGGNITQYQQSTVVYADVNHRITPKLMGTIIGRYSYSSYEGGSSSGGQGDNAYSFSLDLSYQITSHFAADLGYNYDDLQSDVPGVQYDRNRVYFGLSATY